MSSATESTAEAASASAPANSDRPRPQQARSRLTRRRLLSAAVSCLCNEGYQGTRTSEICRRAGVSQGALFKHFSSKTQLLAAAVEDLFTDLVGQYRRDFAATVDSPHRLEEAVRLLWSCFQQPSLQVAYELYLASRSDEDLRRAIEAPLAAHRDNLRRSAKELFPRAADEHPHFDAVVDLLLDSMQGRVLGAMVLPEPGGDEQQLAFLEELVRREFAPWEAGA